MLLPAPAQTHYTVAYTTVLALFSLWIFNGVASTRCKQDNDSIAESTVTGMCGTNDDDLTSGEAKNSEQQGMSKIESSSSSTIVVKLRQNKN